jgi:tetratricopeptide (TPR) repeat protein
MSLLQGRSGAKSGRRFVIDLQKAERAFKEGRHKDVEQICTEVLEARPDNCHACQLMAELRIKQQRIDEAMTWIERARSIEPNNPRSLNLLGRVLDYRGDVAGAEAAFRKAVEGDPEYPDAQANLGHALRRTGRSAEAEQCFRQAIRFDREHGLANLSLGAMLYEQRRPELAVPHLQAGIQRELSNRAGQYILAIALHELGRLDEAITAYRRLVAAGDEDPSVLSGLASALEATGETDCAIAGFEAALELDPEHAPAAAGLAGVFTVSGRAAEALRLLAPLIDRGDAPASLHIAHARALRALGRESEALLHLADLLGRPLRPEELAPAHHLVGDLLDARGEYERAFAHYRRANRLRAGRYQPERHSAFVSRLIGVFSRERLDSLPRGSESDIPVFIVGMPRSGSSVIEQIIAMHSRGAGAGPLPHMDLGAGRIGRYNHDGLPYPECVSVLRERDFRELSAAYLGRLFQESDRARRIVDSMWLNYLHLGLIELLFPNARVIHCRRDALDVGLACYFNAFGDEGEPFSCDLGHIGHYYREYQRLMAHWRVTLKLRMLELDYEALVASPEVESRRIMEFLALPWDPACLDFHQSPRLVRSWSYGQLRRPIHAGHVGHWRHYERHVAPLREALAAGAPTGHPDK